MEMSVKCMLWWKEWLLPYASSTAASKSKIKLQQFKNNTKKLLGFYKHIQMWSAAEGFVLLVE